MQPTGVSTSSGKYLGVLKVEEVQSGLFKSSESTVKPRIWAWERI